MDAFRISEPSEVTGARREAAALAKSMGFSEEDAGRAAIVVTELGTNILKHAGHGEILAGASLTSARSCFEIVALDQGSGMDVDKCLQDGFSTAGSQGTGLGAIRRQATTFDVWSVADRGTAIHVRLCPGRAAYEQRDKTNWAGVVRALRGEEVSGDAVAVRETGQYFTALVSDGLGHGTFAAEASALAAGVFARTTAQEADTLVEAVHAALKSTRGAAIAIATCAISNRLVTYSGMGNIAGALVSGQSVRKMTSMNGTAGVVARRVHAFQYPYQSETLLIMHSDGLSGSWTLDKYPGLAQREPMLIAAVLYRDYGKDRDDACVLVARLR
jgi:anti-sigma regulatory factor (Ser/Thr protein kinase)